MLEATAAARPDSPALTDRAGTLTYARLAAAVAATAAGLTERGLRRGDRVAVWLPKRSEKAIALYGAMRAGGSRRTGQCAAEGSTGRAHPA